MNHVGSHLNSTFDVRCVAYGQAGTRRSDTLAQHGSTPMPPHRGGANRGFVSGRCRAEYCSLPRRGSGRGYLEHDAGAGHPQHARHHTRSRRRGTSDAVDHGGIDPGKPTDPCGPERPEELTPGTCLLWRRYPPLPALEDQFLTRRKAGGGAVSVLSVNTKVIRLFEVLVGENRGQLHHGVFGVTLVAVLVTPHQTDLHPVTTVVSIVAIRRRSPGKPRNLEQLIWAWFTSSRRGRRVACRASPSRPAATPA